MKNARNTPRNIIKVVLIEMQICDSKHNELTMMYGSYKHEEKTTQDMFSLHLIILDHFLTA